MALTNNEKQIRRKQLEALKKYGNDVLLHLILSNSHIIIQHLTQSNDMIFPHTYLSQSQKNIKYYTFRVYPLESYLNKTEININKIQAVS